MAWMAPELFDSGTYSEKTDIYSLGIVIWEVISRKLPFFGAASQIIPILVARGERPPIPKDTSIKISKLVSFNLKTKILNLKNK